MATQKVVGIFSNQESAIKAIERLKASGYKEDEISVLAKHHEDVDRLEDATQVDVDSNDVTDGAVGGALAGGALGGIGALLVELGVIAIPGIGPFLAAGPIAATIGGIIAGGAAGGLVGALVDLGLTKTEAEEYEQYVERGDILVMVDDYPDRDVYGNFYENNSLIRDRYNYNPKNPTLSNNPDNVDTPNNPNDPHHPNNPNNRL